MSVVEREAKNGKTVLFGPGVKHGEDVDDSVVWFWSQCRLRTCRWMCFDVKDKLCRPDRQELVIETA